MARGETLNALIDSVGIPPTALAAKAKIDAKTLLALRLGQVARARTGTVAKLAKAMGVAPDRVRKAIETSRAAAES